MPKPTPPAPEAATAPEVAAPPEVVAAPEAAAAPLVPIGTDVGFVLPAAAAVTGEDQGTLELM